MTDSEERSPHAQLLHDGITLRAVVLALKKFTEERPTRPWIDVGVLLEIIEVVRSGDPEPEPPEIHEVCPHCGAEYDDG